MQALPEGTGGGGTHMLLQEYYECHLDNPRLMAVGVGPGRVHADVTALSHGAFAVMCTDWAVTQTEYVPVFLQGESAVAAWLQELFEGRELTRMTVSAGWTHHAIDERYASLADFLARSGGGWAAALQRIAHLTREWRKQVRAARAAGGVRPEDVRPGTRGLSCNISR